MNIDELVWESWQCAEDRGFHSNRGHSRDDILVRLCLIHSEVSEAVQEVKRLWTEPPAPDVRGRLLDELADILIRTGDLAGCLKLDLDRAVQDKIAYNRRRPYQYGTPTSSAPSPSSPGVS